MLIFKTLPHAFNNAHSSYYKVCSRVHRNFREKKELRKLNVSNIIKLFNSSKYLPIAFQQGLLPWEKIFLESHIPTLLSSGI